VGRFRMMILAAGALSLPLSGCVMMVPDSVLSDIPSAAPSRSPAPSRTPAPASSAAAVAHEAHISAVAAEVTRLVNADRARAGCAPLEWDDRAAAAAQAHSEDMVMRHYFDHTSPDGGTPVDRLRATGAGYRALAENIAVGQQTAQEVVNGWLQSPGHRHNIENCRYTRTGVGYRDLRWTQVFYTPA
jgi:uncharacterized protein YkwD